MKISIKDFFGKCDQIRRKLRIWSHLLKKFLMKNFIFCAALHLKKQKITLGQHRIQQVDKVDKVFMKMQHKKELNSNSQLFLQFLYFLNKIV